jgi:hypothetical protein
MRDARDNANDELQRSTASLANAALDGHGHLAITAAAGCDGCTSARLTTKDRIEFLLGGLETRGARAARRRPVAGGLGARQRHRRCSAGPPAARSTSWSTSRASRGGPALPAREPRTRIDGF